MHRHFEKLSPRQRMQLLEALCGNVPFLASSISKLGPMERSHPSLLQHRNALQQYTFFITWLSTMADQCTACEEKDLSKAAAGERDRGGEREALLEAHVGDSTFPVRASHT